MKNFLVNEWRLLNRGRVFFGAILFFVLLLVILIEVGLGRTGGLGVPALPAVVWLAALLGGVMWMTRSFEAEERGGMFPVIRLLSGGFRQLFLTKCLINCASLLIIETAAFILTIVLLNVPVTLALVGGALVIFPLGAIGLTLITTTFSAMVVDHPRRDLLLPVIVYPLLLPLSTAVVLALDFMADGRYAGVAGLWVVLIILFDLMYGVLSLMVLERIAEGR